MKYSLDVVDIDSISSESDEVHMERNAVKSLVSVKHTNDENVLEKKNIKYKLISTGIAEKVILIWTFRVNIFILS